MSVTISERAKITLIDHVKAVAVINHERHMLAAERATAEELMRKADAAKAQALDTIRRINNKDAALKQALENLQ